MVGFLDGMVEGVGVGEGPDAAVLVEKEGGGVVEVGLAEFVPDVGAGHEGDLSFGVVIAEEDEYRLGAA